MSSDGVAESIVLGEGDGWLVANKPRGISVHDGEDSLVAALADAGYPDFNPCHRLDAETSGVMLLAKAGSKKAGELSECPASCMICHAGPAAQKESGSEVR